MKRFFWKIVFCTVPVLVSALVVGYALRDYAQGGNTFRLGVDLAGGTDLIYEVDLDKFPDGKPPPGFDIQQLAASLKRRIDPADLYNVTIRPAGPYRVEIILPTGGEHQTRAEDTVWNDLLREVAEQFPPKEYKVPVGRTIELLAAIDSQIPTGTSPEGKWSDKNIQAFIAKNYQVDAKADAATREAKWKELLTKAVAEYPPTRYEAPRGRLGDLINRVREQHPESDLKQLNEFIDKNYKVSRDKRHLSGEQVQEVKALISRVGELKFLILANTEDDAPAIEAAKKWFADVAKNPQRKDELERRAVAGKPPPGPEDANGTNRFPVKNDPGQPHSYTWVELGMKERQSLGLSNAYGKDAAPDSWWSQVAAARAKGEPIAFPESMMRGGILLYSRNVLNPRLPETEANKRIEYFVLTRDPLPDMEVTGQHLRDAREDNTGFDLKVAFTFDSIGAKRFEELTTKNQPENKSEASFHRYLAVVLDGKIESAPRLNAIIRDSGVIEGGFKKDEVDRLVRILKAGALPATLKPQPVSESTMGSTLGEDTIKAGTFSVLVAFGAVLVFMLVYYRFAGMVACIALFANLLLTVAFMVVVHATFTLPGLAGLVLMLGMAVDANVLIYERLREERDRGASLALAIRNGYDRAFPTIIDTHLTSIFTAIVLYVVGNDQLKGFGISLTVGLIISLYTSLYMTRFMFDLWQYKGWLHKLSMFRLLSRPNIDFMAIRYYWFTATVVLTLFGITVFLLRGEKGLNIDFMGGTAYGGRLRDFTTIAELRKKLEGNAELPDLSVESTFVNNEQLSRRDTGETKLFTVRTSNKNDEEVQTAISKVLGDQLDKKSMAVLQIAEDNKLVYLGFTDPRTEQPDFASRSQVNLVLTREFNNAKLAEAAQDFILDGLGPDQDGRFKWIKLELVRPLDSNPTLARQKLSEVLTATEKTLAAQPQPERLDKFDSQLAKETQQRALGAILASWAAILLYLWFRFGNWTFGLATVLCLIHDLFFTLGIIAFCHYIHEWMPAFLQIQDFKIDLPTVAALLTLVGYSVSDTIVVFDRIREVRGKNPLLTPQMINDSVNQTLSRTLLTAFSVWLVVTVLYFWGGEGVHLFSFVMVVGVIVGTYSSIYIASPLLLIFGEGAKKPGVREKQESRTAEALA
jgi:SecD/SecF fusion protein